MPPERNRAVEVGRWALAVTGAIATAILILLSLWGLAIGIAYLISIMYK